MRVFETPGDAKCVYCGTSDPKQCVLLATGQVEGDSFTYEAVAAHLECLPDLFYNSPSEFAPRGMNVWECLGENNPRASSKTKLIEFSIGVLLEHATNYDGTEGARLSTAVAVKHFGYLGVEYVQE